MLDITLRILRPSGLNVPVEHIAEVRGTTGSGAIWGAPQNCPRWSGAEQTTPEPIRIRTAADLFQVLASGSLGARLALLRDVLANPRWQVRAQAVRQLAALDEHPLESVKHRVASDFQGERVAAVELLRCQGEEAWLEQTLLGPASPLDQTGCQQSQQQAPA